MGKKNRSSKNSPPTRRQVLSMIGAAPFALDPIAVLVTALAEGFITTRRAEADATVKPRNYLYINMRGGVQRWIFDLPMTPYPDQPQTVISNPHVVTRFKDAGASRGLPELATVPVTINGETLNMPYLWANTIPTSGGLEVPMTSLMSNMLMVRGIRQLIDGHTGPMNDQLRPNPAAGSIDGIVGDAGGAPVPSVRTEDAPYNFKSNRGTSQTIVGNSESSGNPLSEILTPFNRSADGVNGTTYMTRRTAMDTAMNAALSKIADYAKSNQPGAENLFSVRSDAEKMLKAGIGDVKTAYSTLFNKYTDLITRAFGTPILGITDKPVPTGQFPSGAMEVGTADSASPGGTDLRTLIVGGDKKPVIERLAGGMAIAEYLFVNGYSNSVSIGFNSIIGISGIPSIGYGLDSHSTGNASALMILSGMFRAIAACIYEFSTVMKAKGLWNDTVVQLGSEFNRSPKGTVQGSDHGIAGSGTSFFSGAITKPICAGNITTAGEGNYPGTWGVAGKTVVNGAARDLFLGTQASTAAILLRVLSPSSDPALIVEGAAGIVASVDKATFSS